MTNTDTDGTALPLQAFLKPPVSVQVQSVLYNNEFAAVARAVESLARSADLAVGAGVCSAVTLRYGDSSPMRCLTPEQVETLNRLAGYALAVEYVGFGANLGSARGHNLLAADADADFLLVQNPDVVVSPRLLQTLLAPFGQPGVGMTEAKQLPIEHPKDYDVVTGETSWATTACAMIPNALFRQLQGFDADSFFLYCDDVDFSWRVRMAGYRVLFLPAAVVFHDKRLSAAGQWQPSTAEQYYSAEAALILAHKWSRPDLVQTYLEVFDRDGNHHQEKAAKIYRERQARDELPAPLDEEQAVAQFVGVHYAPHRFAL